MFSIYVGYIQASNASDEIKYIFDDIFDKIYVLIGRTKSHILDDIILGCLYLSIIVKNSFEFKSSCV